MMKNKIAFVLVALTIAVVTATGVYVTIGFVLELEDITDAPAASAAPAEEAKIETELLRAANRRLETENARLRGVIHDCLWPSRGVNYPNKPETLVQQHLDFQKLLAGALE
jgi:hypothetical protein